MFWHPGAINMPFADGHGELVKLPPFGINTGTSAGIRCFGQGPQELPSRRWRFWMAVAMKNGSGKGNPGGTGRNHPPVPRPLGLARMTRIPAKE